MAGRLLLLVLSLLSVAHCVKGRGRGTEESNEEGLIEKKKSGFNVVRVPLFPLALSLYVFRFFHLTRCTCKVLPSSQPTFPSPPSLRYYYRHPSLSPSNSCLASLAVRSVTSFAIGLMTWCLI